MGEFGGAWSAKKLDCVSSYLDGYQTALKNKNFETVYIDACCGDGSQKVKDARRPDVFRRGSGVHARLRAASGRTQSPLSPLSLIDNPSNRLRSLRHALKSRGQISFGGMEFHPGDVNGELPKIIKGLNVRRNRAVVFADPFGMQVDWETIEVVGGCPIIDFWYLVPTGLALNRMATKSGKMPKSWSDRLDRFLGEQDWRTRWYRRKEEEGLFGLMESVEKVADVGLIEDDFQARLGQAFPSLQRTGCSSRTRDGFFFSDVRVLESLVQGSRRSIENSKSLF